MIDEEEFRVTGTPSDFVTSVLSKEVRHA